MQTPVNPSLTRHDRVSEEIPLITLGGGPSAKARGASRRLADLADEITRQLAEHRTGRRPWSDLRECSALPKARIEGLRVVGDERKRADNTVARQGLLELLGWVCAEWAGMAASTSHPIDHDADRCIAVFTQH
jgi:hypothetical protein